MHGKKMPKRPNTESQQMLALQNVLKRPQTDVKGVQDFEAKIARDQKELKAMLKRGLQEAEEANCNRRQQLAADIANALSLESAARTVGKREDDALTFPATAISRNHIYADSMDIIQASKRLLQEYREATEQVASAFSDSELAIVKAWQNDVDRTDTLLGIGRRSTLKQVRRLVGVDEGEHEVNEEEVGDGSAADDEVGSTVDPDLSLDRTLRYAERGVKRIAKGLPGDMDD